MALKLGTWNMQLFMSCLSGSKFAVIFPGSTLPGMNTFDQAVMAAAVHAALDVP